MKAVLGKAQGRREFLRDAVRYSLLGGALALGYALSLKRNGTSSACVKTGVCQNCAAFRGCEQPQAQAARSKAS